MTKHRVTTACFWAGLLAVLLLVTCAAEAVKTYTMEKGDTLWDLSAKFYGDPTLYPVFLECNSITNPRTIPTGREIIVPGYDEIKKIAAEVDPVRRKQLIANIQGEAPDAARNTAQGTASTSPSAVRSQKAAAAAQLKEDEEKNLYRSDRAINPEQVRLGQTVTKKLSRDALREVNTGR